MYISMIVLDHYNKCFGKSERQYYIQQVSNQANSIMNYNNIFYNIHVFTRAKLPVMGLSHKINPS